MQGSTSPPPRSSSSSSPPPPPPSSAVLSVLNKSRQDLWKRRLAPGGWPDTLRKYVLDPCHHFWSILLAPIVQQYKILDNGATARFMQVFVTMPLSLAFLIMSTTTTSSSTAAAAGKTEQDARLNAKQDLLLQVTPAGPSSSSSSSLFMLTPPSDTSSAIKGAMAFVITATTDLIGAMLDSHRMNKWWQAIVAFTNYLQASGMSAHLQESIVKPLCRGRLFCNIKILNDIQEEVRCDLEVLQSQTQSPHQHQQKEPKDQVALLQEAGRMMRFATAAYGRDMVASAIDKQVSWEHINTEKKAIVVHTGLQSVDQIPVLVEGLGMAVLRHFIAIDTISQSVVLAIRGTLDLSGALVDVQGMDCDYCLTHGRAHQGIAEQAENIWNASGSKLQELFNNNNNKHPGDDTSTVKTTTNLKDYRLIITGHSLGAGAACLLNLKIHAENLFPGRTVLCYGFAPPPTFALQCPPDHEHDVDDTTTMNDAGEKDGKRDIPKTTTTSRAATIMSRQQLQQAMDHSYCFIHDNDCVPFLSVASVRRLSTLLDTVDNHTEHLWFWQRFQIFWEFTKIPRDITQAVHAVMKQKSLSVCNHQETVAAENAVPTATTTTTSEHQHVSLMIPASTVIWMKKMTHPQKNQNPFRAFPCCPSSLAQLDVFMSPDMLSDHLPEQYEDALDALNEEATTTTTTTTTAAT